MKILQMVQNDIKLLPGLRDDMKIPVHHLTIYDPSKRCHSSIFYSVVRWLSTRLTHRSILITGCSKMFSERHSGHVRSASTTAQDRPPWMARADGSPWRTSWSHVVRHGAMLWSVHAPTNAGHARCQCLLCNIWASQSFGGAATCASSPGVWNAFMKIWIKIELKSPILWQMVRNDLELNCSMDISIRPYPARWRMEYALLHPDLPCGLLTLHIVLQCKTRPCKWPAHHHCTGTALSDKDNLALTLSICL